MAEDGIFTVEARKDGQLRTLVRCTSLRVQALNATSLNVIGAARDGIDAIQEIYKQYRSSEDDDFKTYITQPFLTSVGMIVLVLFCEICGRRSRTRSYRSFAIRDSSTNSSMMHSWVAGVSFTPSKDCFQLLRPVALALEPALEPQPVVRLRDKRVRPYRPNEAARRWRGWSWRRRH